MVKHIVFFKLTKYASSEERQFQMKRLDEIFSPLGKKLSYITEFRTGTNFTIASHAWDFAIDSIFRNKEDLQKYMISKEHVEAVNLAAGIEKTKAVVDYEF